jgi:hypothetical protein
MKMAFFVVTKKKVRKKADTRSRDVNSGFASYGMYKWKWEWIWSRTETVDLYLVFP